jgi:CMP-N,N'-diacetyllegionaminic acid synthase
MNSFTSVLAVIPARGGSQGIPRKNLRLLAGRPLVEHALRAGLAASKVSHVVLTTDDDEIAKVGKKSGANVLLRPTELATHKAATLPVLQHALDHYTAQNTKFDAVVLLEPTSPFRTPAIIDDCIRLLELDDCGSVVTVTQLERNPRYIFSVSGSAAEFYVKEPHINFKQRQDFEYLKRLNGCVYGLRPEHIKNGHLVVEPVKVVEMNAEASINIDTPLDLRIAELTAEFLVTRNLWHS